MPPSADVNFRQITVHRLHPIRFANPPNPPNPSNIYSHLTISTSKGLRQDRRRPSHDSPTPIMLRISMLSKSLFIRRSTHCISSLRNVPTSTYRFTYRDRSMVTSCWRSIWRDGGMAVGSFSRRPMLEMIRSLKPELSRGMKVRSSVKKMCDGCRVS